RTGNDRCDRRVWPRPRSDGLRPGRQTSPEWRSLWRGSSCHHSLQVATAPVALGPKAEDAGTVVFHFEVHHQDVLRQSGAHCVTPLDHEHAVGGTFEDIEIVELVDGAEPVDVDVDNGQETTPVLAHQDERRAHHLLFDTETGGQPTGEAGFART